MPTILITGASSGLGAALAKSYACRGTVLLLGGRDHVRLQRIADQCRSLGAEVHAYVVEVTDQEAMEKWVTAMDDNQAIDMVFVNAGISAGTEGGSEPAQQVRKIFAVNVDGMLNTVLPLIPRMQQRKKGHIILISSLAGYRGLPSSPAYSVSKGAMRLYGEGLRGSLAPFDVNVTVVTPGYIKTPMTDVNEFPMPLLMDAQHAAALIKRKLMKNPARIAFPWLLYMVIWALSCISPRFTDPLFNKLPGKKQLEE